MKIEEPRAMKEIHKIREEIYEETKDMSIEEKVKYIRERTSKLLDERGIKISRPKVRI